MPECWTFEENCLGKPEKAIAAFDVPYEKGELMGVFSVDSKNEDQYGSNSCHAFEGRAVVIVRTKTKGSVRLFVGAKGLRVGNATVIAE